MKKKASTNVIYCRTCTLCKKLYVGETGRRLGDRFQEYPRNVEKDDKSASKLVVRHINLSNHSKQHMAVCSLSLHQGSTESRKTLEQKFIFQIGTLNPHVITNVFHSTNLFYFIHTEISHQISLCEKAFRILLPPIREAKRVSHT